MSPQRGSQGQDGASLPKRPLSTDTKWMLGVGVLFLVAGTGLLFSPMPFAAIALYGWGAIYLIVGAWGASLDRMGDR